MDAKPPEKADLWAVILAGGRGSRFWPWSQPDKPKQFLAISEISGSKSLLQDTVDRATGLVPLERILVVGLAEYADVLQKQLPKVPKENFVFEPSPRNTAACVGVLTAILKQLDPRSVQLWLPSDHYIKDKKAGGVYDTDATESSLDIGQEADFYLYWQINKNLMWSNRFGVFFPGNAYPSNTNDSTKYFYTRFTLTF